MRARHEHRTRWHFAAEPFPDHGCWLFSTSVSRSWLHAVQHICLSPLRLTRYSAFQSEGNRVARVDVLLVNPVAGNGRAGRVLPRVLAALRARGSAPMLLRTQQRGDARAMASSLPHGATIAVLGGDGTVNEVLQGLNGKNSTILLLPAGSG